MKQVVFAIALLTSSAMSAQAAEFVTWQGDIFIKKATTGCNNVGFGEGNFLRAVYTPRNLGDNGIDTRLGLFSVRSAQRYKMVGDAYGNGEWQGTYISSIGGMPGPDSVFFTATMTNASATAATTTTQTVVLKGKLQNFFDEPTCTVTFIGSLGLRVN